MFPLCLGVLRGLCFCVSLVAVSSETFATKPFGYLMCQRMCYQWVGCSSYQYKTFDLSCTVAPKTRTRHDPDKRTFVITVYKNKTRWHLDTRSACRKNSRIFYSRSKLLQCGRSVSEPESERKMTRLLIFPFQNNRHHPGKQLFLRNNSMTEYPSIKLPSSIAVAYVSSSKQLVIAVAVHLIFVGIGDNNAKHVSSDSFIESIAVDEVNRAIFTITSSPGNKITRMSTEGKVKSSFRYKTGCLEGIAADPKRCMLYVVHLHHGVRKYTYSGEYHGVVLIGNIRAALHIDSDRDVLYYMKGASVTICKMSLVHNTHTKVINIGLSVDYFVLAGNRFYIADGRNLVVIGEDNKITRIDTGYDKDVTDVIFCAVH